MEYYRELKLEDPFRRNEREKKSPNDDGDLFGLRRRARKLRVLLDIDSLKEPSTYDERETAAVLMGLIEQNNEIVHLWRIDMSKVDEPDSGREEPGTVYLHRNRADPGPYAFPGPSYGLRVVDKNRRTHTKISPISEVLKDAKDLSDRGTDVVGVTPDDLLRNVLLTQTAQQINADIVVSDSITVGRNDVPSNYQANVFTPNQAIPIIAHYLRTQQEYVINPLGNMVASRVTFYQEGVCAMAPRIWHWLGNVEQSLDSGYLRDAREMIGRFQRALRAFDDLRFHMGSFPTIELYDDIGDCLDRVLVNLCGAVDMMARSMHRALALSGNPWNAKLHDKKWYRDNVRPIFADAKGIAQLDETQDKLESVFKLRNTIHSVALQATGATTEPASYVELGRGRMNLVVPNDTYQNLSQDERIAWGLSIFEGKAVADLATVTATAINRVARFLDRLCWVASFEQVPNRADFLNLFVLQAFSPVGPETTAMIARLLGLQSAAHDDATNAPYPLPSENVASHKRRQRAQEDAERAQKSE